MRTEQDQPIAHIAEQSRTDRTKDKCRSRIDAETQQAPALPLRNLSGAHQFPDRRPARRVTADHPDQDRRCAAARQAEQEPHRRSSRAAQRRPDARPHQKSGQHQKRKQRRDDHGGANGQASAYSSRYRLRPVQQRCCSGNDAGEQQRCLDTRIY